MNYPQNVLLANLIKNTTSIYSAQYIDNCNERNLSFALK